MLARLRHHFPALASVAIRGVGVALGFVLVIAIGRIWGPAGNGIYGLVSQTAMLLAIVSVGGLDLAAVRSLSQINPLHHRIAGGTILRLIGVTLGLAAIPVAVMLIFGDQAIRWLTGESVPAFALAALVVLLVARALVRIISAILRAQHFFLLGQFVDAALIPALFCAVLVTAAAVSIDDLLRWIAIMSLAAIIIGLGALGGVSFFAQRSGKARRAPALRAMMATALPLWGVTIALNLADWYGLMVVTAQLGLTEAGIYRVVMQFSTAFSILSTGLFGVYSVRIGAAQSAQDWPHVARLVHSATRLSAALVIPPVAILLLLADNVLGLVGPAFVAGASALQIALVGQVLYVILGPAGLTLAMTGYARINLVITLTSTAALIICAPLAASHFGMIGVVGAISVLLVARNLVSLVFVRSKLGINALTGNYSARQIAPQ